jgi:hypothetical protein
MKGGKKVGHVTGSGKVGKGIILWMKEKDEGVGIKFQKKWKDEGMGIILWNKAKDEGMGIILWNKAKDEGMGIILWNKEKNEGMGWEWYFGKERKDAGRWDRVGEEMERNADG